MHDDLKFPMKVKKDKLNEEFFVFTTDLPMNFDFSQIVLLIHPYEDEDGNPGAQLTIRRNKYEYVPETVKELIS